MPADETPESLSGFEERLRHLESELSAEQERSRLLENRVRQMEQILEVYGLTLPIGDKYWNGCQYEFRVRGHKRVTLFQILGEISLCLDEPQISFIEFIIKYTDLGTNPNTIKSNLRYAAKRWKD